MAEELAGGEAAGINADQQLGSDVVSTIVTGSPSESRTQTTTHSQRSLTPVHCLPSLLVQVTLRPLFAGSRTASLRK